MTGTRTRGYAMVAVAAGALVVLKGTAGVAAEAAS